MVSNGLQPGDRVEFIDPYPFVLEATEPGNDGVFVICMHRSVPGDRATFITSSVTDLCWVKLDKCQHHLHVTTLSAVRCLSPMEAMSEVLNE